MTKYSNKTCFIFSKGMVALLGIVLLGLCLTGCEKKPERFGFSGTVTLNGSPLAEGNLRLLPQGQVDGSTFCDASIREGKFTFPSEGGLSPGTYLVQISAVDKEKSVFDSGGPGTTAKSKIVELIPPEWNVQSEKTVEVKKGQNIYDFAITK